MAGIVAEVGPIAERFKVGDLVGVGTYVNSCGECEYCDNKLEVHCLRGAIFTYSGVDVDGTITKGGYSSYIVVRERWLLLPSLFTEVFVKGKVYFASSLFFILQVLLQNSRKLSNGTHILCAGTTIFSAMMRHNMKQPGKSLGLGFGGTGRLTVKFGKALGLKVTVFSTSMSNREEAFNIFGADNFVLQQWERRVRYNQSIGAIYYNHRWYKMFVKTNKISFKHGDSFSMQALDWSLDFIIVITSIDGFFDLYLPWLKPGGVLVLLAISGEVKFNLVNIVSGERTISGNVEGGT